MGDRNVPLIIFILKDYENREKNYQRKYRGQENES